jgi:serine protease
MRTRILAPVAAGLVAALALLTRGAPAAGAVASLDPGVAAEPRADGPTFGDETAAPDAIPGEIAVDLRDDVGAADVADLDARFGVAMRPNSGWSTTHDKLEVADVEVANESAILEGLERDPRVEHAEPMALYRATFVPDDPLYASKQWHLKRVGAETAWSYTCGQGITVAVIDTGVACFDKGPFTRGTDLAGTRCEGGWNFVDDNAEAADDHGHGTHVAGTIAQTTHNGVGTAGLAYCATLMPVKVLSRQGFGTVANVAEGIRFAADNGAQVINMSLGGPIKSGILEDAVAHALSRGVLIVAAAGNSGKSVGWPAAYPGVVAVSATDDKDKIAWFSSRGPQVAIAAPGVAITQQTVCNGGKDKCEVFGTFNGTSMAAPHVAGVAAMIESLGVTEPGAVRDVLMSTARPQQEPNLYGAGIVDAGAAASRVFWRHLAWRGLALIALAWLVARRIRKSGGKVARTAGSLAGALVAGVGLVPFAPFLGLAASAGKLRTALELGMRPFGEWDLVLVGAGMHRWLLLASALPAIGLTLLAFASSRVRPFIGGIALGTAALLAQLAASGDAAFVGGPMLARVWMVANALVCFWLARVALDAKRS